MQREYWYSEKADFREVDQVIGAYKRALIPLYSVAHSPNNVLLKNANKGYFIIKGTGAKYEFRVDDTGALAIKQIDFFFGVGREAFNRANQWGRKEADLYKY